MLSKLSNAIRFLSIDMVEKAKSGHPGMPMGMADVVTMLFRDFLKFNPKDPKWKNRDRLILSAGHGSALLYSALYLSGYDDMPIEELKNFRQLHSRTAGHPEYGLADGIETSTGPLGQGLANAVGMALSERMMNSRFGDEIVNHKVYSIVGDGCLAEGISQEAISFAGHYNLKNLIVIFDDNGITIDGPTSISTSDNHILRFQASSWNTISIDGHNYDEIKNALQFAQESDKPTLIACKTKIGSIPQSPIDTPVESASTSNAPNIFGIGGSSGANQAGDEENIDLDPQSPIDTLTRLTSTSNAPNIFGIGESSGTNQAGDEENIDLDPQSPIGTPVESASTSNAPSVSGTGKGIRSNAPRNVSNTQHQIPNNAPKLFHMVAYDLAYVSIANIIAYYGSGYAASLAALPISAPILMPIASSAALFIRGIQEKSIFLIATSALPTIAMGIGIATGIYPEIMIASAIITAACNILYYKNKSYCADISSNDNLQTNQSPSRV